MPLKPIIIKDKQREKRRKARRKRYRKIHQQELAWSQAYYNEHRDEILEKKREYYAKNKYRILIRNHMRRAQDLTARHSLLVAEWKWLIQWYENKCAYCCATHELFEPEMDCIVPISKGGELSMGNVVPACRSCNASKADHDLGVWFAKSNGHAGNVTREHVKQFARSFTRMMDDYYSVAIRNGWGVIEL